MAYVTKDLNLVAPNVGAEGGSVWSYHSADTAVAIKAAGYVDDGLDKGIKVNDLVIIGGATAVVGKVTVVAANGDVTMV